MGHFLDIVSMQRAPVNDQKSCLTFLKSDPCDFAFLLFLAFSVPSHFPVFLVPSTLLGFSSVLTLVVGLQQFGGVITF